MVSEEVTMAAAYPVRLREWVRPGERVVCPDCKGLRWVPVVILAKDGNDWTTTVDCPECHGRGWVLRDVEDGRGYDRVIG